MHKETYVYFILEPASGFLKIGKSKRPGKRLELLQTSTPHQLILLAMRPEIYGHREEDFHRRFDDLRHKGEWFLFEGELKAFIEAEYGWTPARSGWVFINGEPVVKMGTDWESALSLRDFSSPSEVSDG